MRGSIAFTPLVLNYPRAVISIQKTLSSSLKKKKNHIWLGVPLPIEGLKHVRYL